MLFIDYPILLESLKYINQLELTEHSLLLFLILET